MSQPVEKVLAELTEDPMRLTGGRFFRVEIQEQGYQKAGQVLSCPLYSL